MKVYFVDFWVGLKQIDNFIYNALSKRYPLEIDEKHPEVLFFSCYGNHHMEYDNCVKVFYTGENVSPNFSWCDYAMGFDYLEFGDRYIRLPQFAIQPGFSELYVSNRDYPIDLAKRKFCNFVYSNNYNANPIRNFFFQRLSLYKKVDSGGRILNNIGAPVQNKLEFISQYKFTIAFENSMYNGYTTEKLIEPMICKSLPIYFGNPIVDLDFNTESFIWVKDEAYIETAIEEITYLDSDENAYLRRLSAPKMVDNKFIDYEKLIINFLGHIFEQPLQNSYRMPRHGFIRESNDFVIGKVNWDNRRNPKTTKLKKLIKKIINKLS